MRPSTRRPPPAPARPAGPGTEVLQLFRFRGKTPAGANLQKLGPLMLRHLGRAGFWGGGIFTLEPNLCNTSRFIRDKGLGYVREKLTLTEAEPRENVARFFLAALHRDFKAPVRYEPPKPRKPTSPKPPVESREPTAEERQAAAALMKTLKETVAAV